MHISEVTIQHFRSFGSQTTLRFRPGFNCLVGANGAGKSNVLDAVLFALGQDAAQMRSRSWTELTSRARGGPCAVTVKLSDADDELTLTAHVKDESSRVLRLNGSAATVQKVRQALQQRSLDVESPHFCIRQNAAAALLEGGELGALLQQASGASRFFAAVADSQARLHRERGVVSSVCLEFTSARARYALPVQPRNTIPAL